MQTQSLCVAGIIIAVYTCLVLADVWTTASVLRLENTVEVNPFIDIGSTWTILRFQVLPWLLFVVATLWAFPKTVASYGATALTNDLTLRMFNNMRFRVELFPGFSVPVWLSAAVMLVVITAMWSRLVTVANNTSIALWYFNLLPVDRFGEMIAAKSGVPIDYSRFLALVLVKLIIVFPPTFIASWMLLVRLVKFSARGTGNEALSAQP